MRSGYGCHGFCSLALLHTWNWAELNGLQHKMAAHALASAEWLRPRNLPPFLFLMVFWFSFDNSKFNIPFRSQQFVCVQITRWTVPTCSEILCISESSILVPYSFSINLGVTQEQNVSCYTTGEKGSIIKEMDSYPDMTCIIIIFPALYLFIMNVSIIIDFLDISQRPFFYLKSGFRNWTLSLSSGNSRLRNAVFK